MRHPLYDAKAAKRTVSVTLNADLYSKAKSSGINTSKVAEEAIADEYARRVSDALKEELLRDLSEIERYEHEHGSFPELVRKHYERDDSV